jgi:hypothetical protein
MSTTNRRADDSKPRATRVAPPPPLVRRWVRYMVGFAVGTALGLAPYLGTLDVPLFRPLLTLYPITLQHSLIPLSSAIMGLMAVAIQWYGDEHLTHRRLRRWFHVTLASAVAGILALMLARAAFVVDVPIEGGAEHVAFAVGWNRLPTCICRESADALCIAQTLTLNPAQVESCWGSRSVRVAEVLLQINYLLVIASFGVLTGLVLLRDVARESGSGTTRRSPGGRR